MKRRYFTKVSALLFTASLWGSSLAISKGINMFGTKKFNATTVPLT